MADMVNHPPHYTSGKIEVIDFIDDQKLGFYEGQVIKYVARAGKKIPKGVALATHARLEDLQKAQWYLNRLVKQLEDETA